MTDYNKFPHVCVVKITKYFDEDEHIGDKVIFLNRDRFKWFNHVLIAIKDGKQSQQFMSIVELVSGSDEIQVEYISTDVSDLFKGGNKPEKDCTCDIMLLMVKGCQCGAMSK